MNTQQDTGRARQTILYICRKMQDAGGFGSVLLNKVLYYADHTSYLKTGKTLTGFSYVKQKHGPTPDPAEFLTLRDEMLQNKEIRECELERFGFIQKRTVARVAPDLTVFTQDEVALLDEVIQDLKQCDATSVSAQTHEMLAWQIAENREKLPLFTYLLTEDEISEKDLTWGEAAIEKYKAA